MDNCGDYTGYAGLEGDNPTEEDTSGFARSLKDLKSTILIFTRDSDYSPGGPHHVPQVPKKQPQEERKLAVSASEKVPTVTTTVRSGLTPPGYRDQPRTAPKPID